MSKFTEIHPFKVVTRIVCGIHNNVPSTTKPDKLYETVCIFNVSAVSPAFCKYQFHFGEL